MCSLPRYQPSSICPDSSRHLSCRSHSHPHIPWWLCSRHYRMGSRMRYSYSQVCIYRCNCLEASSPPASYSRHSSPLKFHFPYTHSRSHLYTNNPGIPAIRPRNSNRYLHPDQHRTGNFLRMRTYQQLHHHHCQDFHLMSGMV